MNLLLKKFGLFESHILEKELDFGDTGFLKQLGVVGAVFISLILPLNMAYAAGSGDVVFSEIAWSGTADNSNDEWVELFNTSSSSIDLSGWVIKDDNVASFTFPEGTVIGPYQLFLLEDNEQAVSNVEADLIYNLSLANTGDSLVLVDDSGFIIDQVNGTGGAWYAGASGDNSSMERIDMSLGDEADNFASSLGGTGALAANGSPILGTPKSLNSVSEPYSEQPRVVMNFVSDNALIGDVVQMEIRMENVKDFFAYGIELTYDPAILRFENAVEGGFLNESGAVSTSFQVGLVDGLDGKLLLAGARTVDPKIGVDGDGSVAIVNFRVLDTTSSEVSIIYGLNSFASSANGDLPVAWLNDQLNIGEIIMNPIAELMAKLAPERYAIQLDWLESTAGVDFYRIERQNYLAQWEKLADVSVNSFVDQDDVLGGGNLVPGIEYKYRVSAVKGESVSQPVEIAFSENRGLKGDNNRSDMVDGRDLERLALHFAENYNAAGFDPLIDTTYDGMINGSDLIDLGASFALTYE